MRSVIVGCMACIPPSSDGGLVFLTLFVIMDKRLQTQFTMRDVSHGTQHLEVSQAYLVGYQARKLSNEVFARLSLQVH